MESYNIAILGCGTVGSGVAKIITELNGDLSSRAGKKINISKIVDIRPRAAAAKAGVSVSLFPADKEEITKEEADAAIKSILEDKSINLVVETIGGDNDYIKNIHESVIKSGKNIVSANKSLLAKTGKTLFDLAMSNNVKVGFEAAVCGAIPIIKGLTQCFTGDDIITISGIMNGTSNFILSNMSAYGTSFDDALRQAQELGYAEADPSLDINGGDAASKIKILVQMVYGIDCTKQNIVVEGIDKIRGVDVAFARAMRSVIKLICFAHRDENDNVYVTVRPMMIHKDLFLADINGATNAVRLINKYSGENILLGQGAGMLETGSAIVSDIVNIVRGGAAPSSIASSEGKLANFDDYKMPCNLILKFRDVPGVAGVATTAIGEEGINIDSVGQNIHEKEWAYFSIIMENASISAINRAVAKMRERRPEVFSEDVKVFPIIKQ